MHEIVEQKMNQKMIRIYKAKGENLPVIFCNMGEDKGEDLLGCCQELKCPLFHLVTISGFDWDESLSPWPAEPVVSKRDHFTGEGPEYLQWLLNCAIPEVRKTILSNHRSTYIAGYSMAGLFALWSLYQTTMFQGAVCASGSLWYPGFRNFVEMQEFKEKPEEIYLSLGDRESRTANPILKKTEEVYELVEKHYQEQAIKTVFHKNPGNHFQDPELRLAKGLTWIMNAHKNKFDE